MREICLRFAGAEEKLSHGAPSFHVRGKMFLMFVDNHHEDGRLAVWCNSTHEEQRRLVAANGDRFFVPPYVGVKGWIGVIVDPDVADWIELSILVEEAWASVVPPRILREGQTPAGERPLPPSPRVTTDASLARRALERLTAICVALSGATCERDGRHATYRAGKKAFAYFLDNHHGDGIIAACVKGDKREHARTIAADPKAFFLPAYIGSRGYLGIRLDTGHIDWNDVAERVASAHRNVTPKRSERVAAAPRSAAAKASRAKESSKRGEEGRRSKRDGSVKTP